MINVDVEKYLALKEKKYYRKLGKVSKIVGLTIESIGPDARLNDLCRITSDKSGGQEVMAEVVGFMSSVVLPAPRYPVSMMIFTGLLGMCPPLLDMAYS